MVRNLFFIALGLFGGLWLSWPGVTTKKGWKCSKDIVFNSEKQADDPKSFVDALERKVKLSYALSPNILLKSENLKLIDKLRLVGDACFRF